MHKNTYKLGPFIKQHMKGITFIHNEHTIHQFLMGVIKSLDHQVIVSGMVNFAKERI